LIEKVREQFDRQTLLCLIALICLYIFLAWGAIFNISDMIESLVIGQ
jgi:hypothetical protein